MRIELNSTKLDFINNAVETISDDRAKRMELDNILVYKCGSIIRIDIKEN